MKVVTIAQMTLRTAVLLALILGIAFWISPALPAQNQALKDVHMLLGFLVVLALWVIGLAQGFVKGGGSFGLALGTFIVGLAVAIVGLWQESWRGAGVNVQLLNIIHLLLGLGAAGFGEMIGARARRRARAQASASA
ncbi:MAG TPA: hypothetical protein VGF67_14470 [Ktedonobacteraceae bacterium]|jgi:hypothetical protein